MLTDLREGREQFAGEFTGELIPVGRRRRKTLVSNLGVVQRLPSMNL
jgi:hypothetical protein